MLKRKTPSGQTPTMRERVRERYRETDKEDDDALLCISGYTTSRVKGTNTFVLSTLKVQTYVVQEALLQRSQP